MFGRLVDVEISNAEGETLLLINHNLGNKSLVCDGVIKNMPSTSRSSLELNIYNLSSSIRSTIKADGYKYITVKFGYRDLNNGELDIIFKGTLARTIHQRQDANTSVTKFYAYDLGEVYDYGYFSGTFEKGTTIYDAIMTIAKKGEERVPVYCSDALKNYTFNENKSMYGNQLKLIGDLAKSCNMMTYITMGRVMITTQQENENTEVIVLTAVNEKDKLVSASGLIGIPTMEDDGVSFECLVNPRMTVFSIVLIANSLISDSREGFEPSNEVGAEFDTNGLYRVITIETTFTNGAGENKMKCRALSRDYYADVL